MPNRQFSSNTYRYGFNGKENDNEVKGVQGSQQDYGMRIYDPRLGKFLSVDPLTYNYPMLTPYQFASNRPIDGSDLDGMEWTTETDVQSTSTHVQIFTTYKVHLSVLNSSNLNDQEKEKKLELLKGLTEAMFQSTIQGKIDDKRTYTRETKMVINYTYVESSTDNNFILELVDYIPNPTVGSPIVVLGITEELGNTQKNRIGLVIKDKIEFPGFLGQPGKDYQNPVTNQAKALAEELGHSAGLGHTGTEGELGKNPDETDNIILSTATENNVMIQGGTSGMSSTFVPAQHSKIRNQIKSDTANEKK